MEGANRGGAVAIGAAVAAIIDRLEVQAALPRLEPERALSAVRHRVVRRAGATRDACEVARASVEGSDGVREGLVPEGREDRVADELGDLGDYGVSEGTEPVQPVGNPIRYSTKTAGGYAIPNRCAHQSLKFIPPPSIRSRRSRPAPFPSQATGRGRRGNEPHSFANEMGTNAGRWNTLPFRIEPDLGQVSKNAAEPAPWLFCGATKQVCDVLHADELGSKVASKSDDLAPQAATCAANACLAASNRDILAGETARDDVNGSDSVSSQSLCGEASDVAVTGDTREVDGEPIDAPRVDFAERDRLETACAFEAKAEPSYATEKIEDAQLLHAALHGSTVSFAGKLAFSSARTDGS